MKVRTLAPFGGLVTSVDPALLKHGSPSQQNCEVEDGAIGWRLGYRSVIGSVTNQTGVRMFDYFSTYTSSGTFMDGFVSVNTISGARRLYEVSLNASSDEWEYHEILFGGSSFALAATFSRSVAFRDKVYIFNRDSSESGQDPGPLLIYTPGSYAATAVKRPSDPTTAITVDYAKNASGGTAYSVIRWSGADPVSPADTDEVTYDGTVASSTGTALTGELFEVEHLDVKGTAFVQFQLNNFTEGDNDLTYCDVFSFSLIVKTPASFQIDPSDVHFYLGNSGAGSAATELTVQTFPQYDSSGNLTRVDCYASFTNKTRSSWATTRYVKIAYSVKTTSSTVGNNHLFISPVTCGGMVDWFATDFPGIAVGYSYRNTTTGYESGILGPTELVKGLLLGDQFAPSKGSLSPLYMGTIPVLNSAATSEADKVRFYVAHQVKSTGRAKEFGKWRLPADGEQNDTDTTYIFHTIADEFEDLADSTPPSPFRHDDIVCAAVVGQYVAWGYRGGEQNVRLSRVGDALLQADPDDVLVSEGNTEDLARGATFSLTDDHTDSPKGFVPCGSVLVILGEDGVYAMVDTGQGPTKGIPSSMSPPRRVPGAPGTIGYQSFCKGADKFGNPGVFYVTKDGGAVKFLQVFENFDGKSGFRIVDVSEDIHNDAFSEMLYGSSRLVDPEVVMCFVDPVTDSVWVFYNNRALKFMRPSRAEGKKGVREWAFADYEEGQYGSAWQKVVQAGQRGIFGMRLNGTVDEFDRANIKQSGSSDRCIVPLDASAFTPTSTNTGTERVVFSSPPGWTNGWGVKFATANADFNITDTYYVRRIDGFTYEFYDTRAHAVNTGATTGRVNLTVSVTSSIRPIGQDDGSVPTSCFWVSPNFIDDRRRAFRVRLERESTSDLPVVTAIADRATQSVTLVSGEKHVRFGHTVSGNGVQYKIALPVLSGKVTQCECEEAVIGGRKSA